MACKADILLLGGQCLCVCRGNAWRHSLNCGTNSNEGSPLYLTLEAWPVTGPRNGPCNCSRAKRPQKSRNSKPSLFLHEFTYGPGGQFDRGFNKYSLEVCQILKWSAPGASIVKYFLVMILTSTLNATLTCPHPDIKSKDSSPEGQQPVKKFAKNLPSF